MRPQVNCDESNGPMSAYLDFVKDTVDTLRQEQSIRISGNPYPSSTLCLAITSLTNRGYLSLGSREGESFCVFPFPEKTPDELATRMDLQVWPVLESLTEATGDETYRDLANDMAAEFAVYGFDPKSGLAYWGQEAEFDVVLLGPGPNWGRHWPKYKPDQGLPRETMWERVPEKMERMFRSLYYGLITDRGTMDYNRFCAYGFDDAKKALSMPWDPGHRAFATTGAWLIEDWAFCFAKTGDTEMLGWAQQMADKWLAVQNADTGLLPHFFGSTCPEETTMAPRAYCDVGDSATAMALLRAGGLLRERQDGQKLAEQVEQMGLRLIRGLARHAYDEEAGLFRHWIRIADGEEDTEAFCYSFRTQEQKDHWVATDPALEDVCVFEGFGFYRGGVWNDGTFLGMPLHVAQAAEMTGDECLLQRGRYFVERIVDEAERLDGPLNHDGQWTFDASAGYLRMMLCLYRAEGEKPHLANARRLADRELDALSRPLPEGTPDWWRMPQRNTLLAALLELESALAAAGD